MAGGAHNLCGPDARQVAWHRGGAVAHRRLSVGFQCCRPVRLLSTALAVAVETSVTPATPRPRDRPLPASVAEATDARFGAVVVTTFGASYSNCTPNTEPAAAASEVPRPWYPRRREACARCHRPARHHRRRRR